MRVSASSHEPPAGLALVVAHHHPGLAPQGERHVEQLDPVVCCDRHGGFDGITRQ